MSLINQMLQELDARGANDTVPGAAHVAVRAVPENGKSKTGWWIALLLAVMLGAVAAWIWLRGPASASVPMRVAPRPKLNLKLAPELHEVQIAAARQPSAGSEAANVGSASPIRAPAVEPAGSAALTDTSSGGMRRSPESNDGASTASPPKPAAIPAPAPAKMTPIRQSRHETQKSEPAAATEEGQESSLDRQIKEPTLQQHAENGYRKALSLAAQGETAEAVAALEQTLKLYPQHAAARQALVGLLLENNRQDEAVSSLKAGLELDPAQAGLAMILARLEIERNDLRGAVDTLQRTLPHAADRADYQAFLAALLQRQARHKEAIEHYLLALRKAPQNGVWWMGLGISMQGENRLPEAREAFGKAKATRALSPDLQAFVDQKLKQLQH